jgi:hypothetical protein
VAQRHEADALETPPFHFLKEAQWTINIANFAHDQVNDRNTRRDTGRLVPREH